MSHPGNDQIIDAMRDEMEDKVPNLTPDMAGLLRFIRHTAKTDRHTARLMLIWGTKKGWCLKDEQMERILDGENLP
jgi:hypothetical protein